MGPKKYLDTPVMLQQSECLCIRLAKHQKHRVFLRKNKKKNKELNSKTIHILFKTMMKQMKLRKS